ncbi:sensor histidine kinase [Actinoplanes solisilvae]|uniref:sensor histidine kinase n=1 Tax=Actinoplanes solisilvae TaxID=2486853 RepID=UPI0013E3D474|nr:histidine kinase [Actinoplanes solisilvae]
MRISAIVDLTAALGLTLLAAFATLDPPGPAFTGPTWVVWLAAAAAALPIAIRRRWPLPVLGGVLLATAAATAFGVVGPGVIWVAFVPAAIALYSAATATGQVVSALALAATVAVPVSTIPWLYHHAGISPADSPASEAPLWWQVESGMTAVIVTAAWVTGRVVRWRRAVRDELARRAVSAERLRIARELHDIVGHSLGLIALKATIANHVADDRPAEARAALTTIEETSRAALAETRRLLGVLRDYDDDERGDPAGELAPAPGTADLGSLAERLRSSGMRVEMVVDGVYALPPALDLTVYRIVQEALTNVLKHANAAGCHVTVRADDDAVRIEVNDDGRGGGGHGLVGMRERVSMYGGTLTTGPQAEGGYRVVAEIPLEGR